MWHPMAWIRGLGCMLHPVVKIQDPCGVVAWSGRPWCRIQDPCGLGSWIQDPVGSMRGQGRWISGPGSWVSGVD